MTRGGCGMIGSGDRLIEQTQTEHLPYTNGDAQELVLVLDLPWDAHHLVTVNILSVDSKSSPVLDFPRWKSSVFPAKPQYVGSAGPR